MNMNHNLWRPVSIKDKGGPGRANGAENKQSIEFTANGSRLDNFLSIPVGFYTAT